MNFRTTVDLSDSIVNISELICELKNKLFQQSSTSGNLELNLSIVILWHLCALSAMFDFGVMATKRPS